MAVLQNLECRKTFVLGKLNEMVELAKLAADSVKSLLTLHWDL